ncbi:MAG TPA: hypothetical protein VG501_01555 [Rhizomicrobium sp.]|nr:hypothetical protein [Rhizomicrobium sp.]
MAEPFALVEATAELPAAALWANAGPESAIVPAKSAAVNAVCMIFIVESPIAARKRLVDPPTKRLGEKSFPAGTSGNDGGIGASQ